METVSQFRRAVCIGLVIISLATVSGRLASVRSYLGKTPMLSANDRSRWSTVRALVENGSYELDDVIFVGPEKKRNLEWHTIDLVRHRGHDGKEHYYSSKPPLLATLLAGKYWLLHELTGAEMRHHSFLVIITLLVTTNVIPLALYFWLMLKWTEEFGATEWGRWFVMAAATFGTFLTTFAITLNNHLPAAISTLIAAYAFLRIVRDGRRSWKYFAICGFFTAFTVANELPAVVFAAVITVLLLMRDVRGTILAFLPPAMIVAAAFFGTNYLAHGTWRPAYGSRSDGPLVARVPYPQPAEKTSDDQPIDTSLREALRAAHVDVSDGTVLKPRVTGSGWQLWDPAHQRRYACQWDGPTMEVREWGNWYEYENSYWLPENKRGVDRGEPDRAVYAFHVLIGHHGIFSLTPLWLLSVWGLWLWIRQPGKEDDRVLRTTALAIALVSLVCIVFYLMRPLIDRNYGGVTSGFRWTFWMTPLWMFLLIPAADHLAERRWTRVLAMILLAISVFSASYPATNPWTQPWIYKWALGI